MKKYWNFILISNLIFTLYFLSSCREESDDVVSYGQVDYLNFHEANTSFRGQFEAIWTAMNCNYALWDYEQELGVNWDEIYNQFLPEFEKLDQRQSNGEIIGDDEIDSIYQEVIKPLHDGHLYLQVKNPYDKESYLIFKKKISPARIRNSLRVDFKESAPIDKDYYRFTVDTSNNNRIIEYDKSSNGNYEYCLFNGNVVYIRLKDFLLTDSLGPLYSASDKPTNTIQRVWGKWFNKIRNLHESNTLNGIIIDIRDNGGGYASDFDYGIGALQPIDTSQPIRPIGYYRIKTGIGRLDYSVLIQSFLLCLGSNHLSISEEPIVLLANCNTASSAEINCLGAKQMKNSRVVGMRTWGALSSLFTSQDMYSITYSGHVGSSDIFEKKYSFYIYMPHEVFFTCDLKILEGVGVEPDIEVRFDEELYNSTGRDSQLERALRYIRTGE